MRTFLASLSVAMVLAAGCAGVSLFVQPASYPEDSEKWIDVPDGATDGTAQLGAVLHFPLGWELPNDLRLFIDGKVSPDRAYYQSISKRVYYVYRAETIGEHKIEFLDTNDKIIRRWTVTVSERPAPPKGVKQ